MFNVKRVSLLCMCIIWEDKKVLFFCAVSDLENAALLCVYWMDFVIAHDFSLDWLI